MIFNRDEELGLQPQTSKKKHRSLLVDELSSLTALAVPVVFTFLMEQLPGLVSIILVGHFKSPKTEEYLDATALAVAFMNLTGLSIGIGLTTAMDTLCSQAYGANQTHKMSIYIQTGVLVLSGFCLLIGIVFYNATSILVALGQPLEVSELAGEAVWVLLPGVPFLFFYELLRRVLQAQNIATPMFVVSILANVFNIASGYYLIHYSELGWLGATFARTATNVSFLVLLSVYLLYSDSFSTFWTKIEPSKAVQGIPIFLELGIPGMLQLCFEWWAFEILALECGLLPNAVDSIGANAVILNISTMAYMFYLGLSISGNVRIGNALGARDPQRAKIAAFLTIGICVFTACLCAAFLFLYRHTLPSLFTHDEAIGILATKLIVVSAIFQIPDSINSAVQGVFRGTGRQILGARLNFVAFYLIGIPVGCGLAFFYSNGLGVIGLWWGMTVGLVIIAIFGTALVWKSDWQALSMAAQERIDAE